MMKIFDPEEIKKLYKPPFDSKGEDNGQITIIGGSKLFHGAPIFALTVASRIVDMVFFTSPDPSIGRIAEQIKSRLYSFIWIPFDEVDKYIEKSDSVLIGPGMKRFTSESQNPNDKKQMTNDKDGEKTREITKRLLTKYPNKKWVIDAGSLQTMDVTWIPEGSIITPNNKEFEILFGTKFSISGAELYAKRYKCIIVSKGPESIVFSPSESILVKGGNAGLTKGGSGDVLAGLTVSLLAKNDPFLAASCASYVVKKSAEELYLGMGTNYNSDDLADKIPETLHNLTL